MRVTCVCVRARIKCFVINRVEDESDVEHHSNTTHDSTNIAHRSRNIVVINLRLFDLAGFKRKGGISIPVPDVRVYLLYL